MELCQFIVFLTLCLSRLTQCEHNYDGPVTIKLYHQLEEWPSDDNWIPSALITFQKLYTGNVNVKLVNWNATASKKLTALAKKDKLYKTKSIITTSKGREVEFRSFTKARVLILKNVTTTLTVTLDHSGSVMGVTLQATAPKDDPVSLSPVVRPTVIVRTTELGPVPDTATYIQKLERERIAKERGGNLDNRSFFAKYWMYILLVIIFAVISGSTNGDSGQNGT